MALSLTLEQVLERLTEPQRIKLLVLAINEDAKSIFPLHFTNDEEENSRIMTEALRKLAKLWLFRAIRLAYDETLD